MEKQIIRPFVKWAGGKKQLLHWIHKLAPKNFDRIVEPFVGGGSVFLSFFDKKAIINDCNKELITTYRVFKKYPEKIINTLNLFLNQYLKEPENYYKKIRSGFDFIDIPKNYKNIYISSRFIFLNKTCFNGLYRVNSNGIFNTPWNGKKDLKISTLIDVENARLINKRLKNVIIKNLDFSKLLKLLNKNDFVFVDPPYDSDTVTFDSYTTESFGKEGQKRLKKWLDLLTKKGIKWMLTNHDTKLIRELYKDYNFTIVDVNRTINADGTKRFKATKEVIIRNY